MFRQESKETYDNKSGLYIRQWLLSYGYMPETANIWESNNHRHVTPNYHADYNDICTE